MMFRTSQGGICFGCGPLPVTVTTRIITFLVGNPYKPSFATVTGRGPHPRYVSFLERQFSVLGKMMSCEKLLGGVHGSDRENIVSKLAFFAYNLGVTTHLLST